MLVYPSSALERTAHLQILPTDFLCWACFHAAQSRFRRLHAAASQQQFPPKVVFLARARPGLQKELVTVLPRTFESGVLHSPIGPGSKLAILCTRYPLGTVLDRSAPVDVPFLGSYAERPE